MHTNAYRLIVIFNPLRNLENVTSYLTVFDARRD